MGSSAIAARPKLEKPTDPDAFRVPIETTAVSVRSCTTFADQMNRVVGAACEVAAVIYADHLVEKMAEIVFVYQGC